MKTCDCEYWKNNIPKLISAIIFFNNHGYVGLENSFDFCPYCGNELKELEGESK